MPRLVWITDPHFNFVTGERFYAFIEEIAGHAPDALLVGGDIAEARDVGLFLNMMDEAMDCPIYFVLGNHDFYHGSIAGVRAMVREICRGNQKLIWLNDAGVISLSPTTALIGHDGWADGRLGDYAGSTVLLNDYLLIDELAGLDAMRRLIQLNGLGDEAAGHVRKVLPAAQEHHRQTILLTHVPPFLQSCWHEGKISGDDWLPHMSCGAAGDAIAEIMGERPDRKMLVLCGHTHSGGEVDILDNVHVSTGGAKYGAPAIARVWDVD